MSIMNPVDDNPMKSPYDHPEYKKSMEWYENAQNNNLTPQPCVAAWIDICGFGAELEKAGWNLIELQDQHLLKLLSSVYLRLSSPFWISVPPFPFETTLIINDGVAKTVDLTNLEHTNGILISKYIEELLIAHYHLLMTTKKYGLGVRIVVAGGERIQYSYNEKTGYSMSFYNTEQISPFTEKMLKQNYLYNPAEFQMNTAFAKAYSIDSQGTKAGFIVNGFFIEKDFLNKLSKSTQITIEYLDKIIKISSHKLPSFDIVYDEIIPFEFKGLKTEVYRVVSAIFYEDGEKILFDLTKARD